MIFLAILIPIYALLIISAGAYIKSLQDQALANVQSILELELARLDAELSSIDWFYYNVQEENADFQQIMQWDGSTEEKMSLAAQLLTESDLKSYAIAESLGYENYANFVNMFKKTYGVSPNAYQETNRKNK